MRIDAGFFEDFKGSDTILFDGDPDGLMQLARVLRALEEPDATATKLHELAFVNAHGGLKVTVHPVGREMGIRRCGAASQVFCWYHSEERWLEAAEKIEQVAISGGGHNWLESIGCDDAVVMVSSDEYKQTFWLDCHG